MALHSNGKKVPELLVFILGTGVVQWKKNVVSGAREPGFKTWPLHLQASGQWANYNATWCLGFLFANMEIIVITTSTSQCYCTEKPRSLRHNYLHWDKDLIHCDKCQGKLRRTSVFCWCAGGVLAFLEALTQHRLVLPHGKSALPGSWATPAWPGLWKLNQAC